MTVRPDDARPPHQQIADDLRRMIDEGELAAGERLPSTRELAIRYDVAPATVQAALTLLRGEGTVESRAGQGTFVGGAVAAVTTADGGGDTRYHDLRRHLDEVRAELTDAVRRIEVRLTALELAAATPRQDPPER